MDTETLFATHIYLIELRLRLGVCQAKDKNGILKLIAFYENFILRSAKETYEDIKNEE